MSFVPARVLEGGLPNAAPDLVVLGNLLVDDIVYPNGKTLMGEPGGAAIYVSLAARLWGATVGVASVRGDDYPARMLDELVDRGVQIRLRDLGRNGVRTWLLYEEKYRRVIHHLGCPSHEEVSPTADMLQDGWESARAYHLAPMPFEVQKRLVAHLAPRKSAAIAVDPHETVREDNLAAWRDVLAHVDAFFPSRDDLWLDGVDDDPRAALRRLAGGRLRFVAFKRDAEGGLLYDAKANTFLEWPPVPRLTGDPTGAGDAFAGGFLSGILAGEPLEVALDRGIVATSFALEDFGARGLVAATREEADRRLREWFDAGATT